MIIIRHNYGFFSCCSIKLNIIVDFINSNKRYKIIKQQVNYAIKL